MEMRKKRGILTSIFIFALVMLTSSQVFSYEVRGEQSGIFLIRPASQYIDFNFVPQEYLSVEDLNFLVCIEEEDIEPRISLLCEDDISFFDLVPTEWSEDSNCYISSFDLSQKDCVNYIIEAEYTKDDETSKMQKRIKVNRLSSIIDFTVKTQYSDGGWRTAVDTAAGIWVLSHYKDIFDEEIDHAIDWLKLNRDNDNKCWPDLDCSVKSTAKILAYLTKAELNRTRRIVHDSEVYLKHKQNFFLTDDTWTVWLYPLEDYDTNCLVNYNYSNLNDWSVAINQSHGLQTFNIEAKRDMVIDIVCDRNFRANLTTEEGDLVFIYEGDNMTYTIPPPCWSKDAKWGDCDIATTEFALLTNISSIYRERGLEYLRTELVDLLGDMNAVGREMNLTEAALYLSLENESGVLSWLRFKQNNNGSWGDLGRMQNILPTGFSILGLLHTGMNRTDEVIEDAERWVSERELEFVNNVTVDYAGWNSTEKNALGFIVLKNNQRPVLKSNPGLIIMDRDKIELELVNPTTFDLNELSYNLSSNLEDIVGVEVKERLSSYSYTIIELTKNTHQTSNIYGFLSVNNLGDETARIPIIILNTPDIEITAKQENLIVFGTNTQLEFSVSKTGHKFDCELRWDSDVDLKAKEEYEVNSNSITVDVVFDRAERAEKKYKGSFVCEASGQEFKSDFAVDVSRYSTFPFTFSPTDIYINTTTDDHVLTVKNKLDETLNVRLGFSKEEPQLTLSENDISIDPSDEYNVTIINRLPANENISRKNSIEITALGQNKPVSMLIDVKAKIVHPINPIVLWIIITLVFAFIGVGVYFGWRYWPQLKKMLVPGAKEDKFKLKIKKMEEKEKNTAIMNMVKIMRFMKKDDSQIRSRLKEEGFSDEDIDTAIEQGEQMEAEEKEKEKEKDENKEEEEGGKKKKK
jgi:hypothetical protein